MALSRGAISAESVAHILDQRTQERREPPPLEPFEITDGRARALDIQPHDLEPYDALGGPKDGDNEEPQ